MGKLRVFFTIVLVAALLPLNAFGRHKKGDVVQDPNHSNITRECVSDEVEESDRWLVHITGTLPVTGMHNLPINHPRQSAIRRRAQALGRQVAHAYRRRFLYAYPQMQMGRG